SNGEQPRLGQVRVMLHRPPDDRRVRDPDRVGVRDRDRAGHGSRLLDPGHPGHLAVAVLGMNTGGTRIAGVHLTARVDRGDAGPDVVPFDQRGVPDLDAGYVREGVGGPGDAREGARAGSMSEIPVWRLLV